MSVKLWAPDYPDGCHIALTNGRTFMVPNYADGIEVPKEFRRAAMFRGCVPVGMKSEDAEADTFDRMTMIRGAAKHATPNASTADTPTHQEVPPRGTAGDPGAQLRPEATDEPATADHVADTSAIDRTAGEILCRLRQAGGTGLSRTAISGVFKHNLSVNRIGTALELLRSTGRAICESVSTAGRPTELWRASD